MAQEACCVRLSSASFQWPLLQSIRCTKVASLEMAIIGRAPCFPLWVALAPVSQFLNGVATGILMAMVSQRCLLPSLPQCLHRLGDNVVFWLLKGVGNWFLHCVCLLSQWLEISSPHKSIPVSLCQCDC